MGSIDTNFPVGIMDMNKALEASSQIFGIVDRKSRIDPNPYAGLKMSSTIGKVSVQDAVFSYPTRKSTVVLNQLRLSINNGEKIALVGPSGK